MPETWYKVDNVAKVFIATSNRRDPRVFRVSCTLADTEPEIDPARLNRALEKTARQFRPFQVTLHRGLFWNYLESTDKLPCAVPETLPPCAELYSEGGNELLYRVSYYRRRVNLEMFHALTDGNGGMAFLQTLICCYLKECYPEQLAGIVPEYDASDAEIAQDGFKQFYGKRKTRVVGGKTSHVCKLRGGFLPYEQTQFFELHLSAAAAVAKARENGVSLTSWLAALLVQAIHAETPALERARPIAVSLPVNLRNYYPTATARNFFNTVKVFCTVTGQETTKELAAGFDAQLRERLSEENVKAQMDSYEQLERNPALKPVPLWIKNKGVSFFTWLENRSETVTVSNLGKVKAPAGLEQYIRGYTPYCSTHGLFLCVCSYGDDLCLGAASVLRNTNVLKNLARSLSTAGLELTLYATEVEQ